ncbi:MAG: PilZ domain-containing protein [Desulfocurvibacter africanus]
MKSVVEEKREYTRLPKSFRVEIRKLAFPLNAHPAQFVESVDISVGGLRVECRGTFEAGDKVQVRIFIPSLNKFHPGFLKVFESATDQSMQAIGEVVRVEGGLRGSILGIKFVDVDQDDWKALHLKIQSELSK